MEVFSIGGAVGEAVLGDAVASAVGGVTAWQALKGFGYIARVGANGLVADAAAVDLMMELTVMGATRTMAGVVAATTVSLRGGILAGSALESALAMPQVPLDQSGPNAPALCAAAGSGN